MTLTDTLFPDTTLFRSGDALTVLLEGRRGALHVVLGAHRGVKQQALTLVGLVNLAFELLHEGKVDGSAQRTSPLKGDGDLALREGVHSSGRREGIRTFRSGYWVQPSLAVFAPVAAATRW